MKRILIPLMLFAIAACSLEVDMTESPAELIQQEITITATSGEPDTRTERAADGSVLWSPGDQISLFYGSGENGGSCFTAQNTETAKTVNFTGTIGVITGGNNIAVEDTYFWAVYPYNATASCDGNSITTVLPSEQVATADTFADDLFPSMGRSQGLNMAFYNICGGIKFTVSEEGIKSVTLRGHNEEVLAGKITVAFDSNGLPTITRITEGAKEITLAAPEGETLQVGSSYFIVLAPTVFENGLTLIFNKGNTWASYDRNKSTTIRRSIFGSLSNPDSGLQWNQMQYVSISDENFRAYMIQNFDSNGDGKLDELEAAAVRQIDDLNTDSISSLSGIESLVNLERLRCVGGGSTGIKDNYENYTYYSGGEGQLTSLDLSHNPLLKYVNCSYNQITNIDLSNNTLLDKLYCGYNLLEELDLSANTALTYINCNGNQKLKSLDLSNNSELREMNFMYNDISSIDLSGHAKLEQVMFSMGHLAYLDISGCSSLQKIYCHEDRLETLRTGNNTALTYMNIWGNRLTSLDLSSCPALTSLYCDHNQLTSLDVSSCASLAGLYCYDNQLSSLNVNGNANLSTIKCYNNQLTSLDVSSCASLAGLYCYHNQLTSLDVSLNTELQFLECYYNQLTSLDVSSNSMLCALHCASNLSLEEIWLSLGQTINTFEYDNEVSTIKYKGINYETGIPLEITNADQLVEWLAKANNGANGEYRITASEIDMTGKSIVMSRSFPGTLEGNGCVIKNLVSGMPLFYNLRGTVKNLVFDNSCCFSPTVPVYGVIANESYGLVSGIVNNAELLYTEGTIDEANKAITYGSIVGANYGTVENCTNTASVTLHYSTLPKETCRWGGVVGYTGGIVNNCSNSGAFDLKIATPASGAFHSVGGVVGMYEGTAGQVMVSNCSNMGNVSLEHESAAYFAVGGVVGGSPSEKQAPGNYGIVDNCSNEGNVSIHYINGGSGAYPNIGGVLGYTEGQLRSCTNRGDISILCDSPTSTWTGIHLAGVAGTVTQGASDCHNYGSISASCLAAGGTLGNRGTGNINTCCFGGVIASAGPFESDGSVVFENCSNNIDINLTIGSLTETPEFYCGGLFGYVTGAIDNCINIGDISFCSPARRNRLGGIAGGCIYDVSNCTNNGNLKVLHTGIDKEDWRSFVGGIVSSANNAGNVTYLKCTNSGNLTFESTSSIATRKTSTIGGIVGCDNDGNITFSECSNVGLFNYTSIGAVSTGDLLGGNYN